MIILWLLLFFFQDKVTTKPASEFAITTLYELKKKPVTEAGKIYFDDPAKYKAREKESGTDMLPYLIINLKVKKWNNDVTQVRVINSQNKVFLKKKPTDEGIYTWEMGYIDDIKDKVAPGKFLVQFMAGKTAVEQIVVQVEEDGTFLVNGEKRGKF